MERKKKKNRTMEIQKSLCDSFSYLSLDHTSGAKARITCEATEDKNNGNGNPKLSFSIETDETDIYGLFIETFSVSYMREVKLNIEKCKVFLEAPPPESTCKVATNVNNGKKGAQLSSVRIFNDKILYTVGPFIYASSY